MFSYLHRSRTQQTQSIVVLNSISAGESLREAISHGWQPATRSHTILTGQTKYDCMEFVPLNNDGIYYYEKFLEPNRGKAYSLIETLESFCDEGKVIIGIPELRARFDDQHDYDDNISKLLNPGEDGRDVRSAGALIKLKAHEDISREPLQINEKIVRDLAHGYNPNRDDEIVLNMKRYLGNAYESNIDVKGNHPLEGHHPSMAASLCSHILDLSAVKPEGNDDPEVAVNIRNFGRPEEESEWIEDYPLKEHILDAFSKQYHQLAILIVIRYKNIRITNKSQVRYRLNNFIMEYNGASLHKRYDLFEKLISLQDRIDLVTKYNSAELSGENNSFAQLISSQDRINYLQTEKNENPEGLAPLFKDRPDIDRDNNRMRIASLYRKRIPKKKNKYTQTKD